MAAYKNRSLNTKISLRKARYYVLALIPLLIAFIFLEGDSGLINQYRLMRKVKKLEREILELERERARLEEEIRLLEYDEEYIEKIAREEYNLAKPDEILFILKDDEKDH
jgi:cell division protein FtsB